MGELFELLPEGGLLCEAGLLSDGELLTESGDSDASLGDLCGGDSGPSPAPGGDAMFVDEKDDEEEAEDERNLPCAGRNGELGYVLWTGETDPRSGNGMRSSRYTVVLIKLGESKSMGESEVFLGVWGLPEDSELCFCCGEAGSSSCESLRELAGLSAPPAMSNSESLPDVDSSESMTNSEAVQNTNRLLLLVNWERRAVSAFTYYTHKGRNHHMVSNMFNY